MNDDDVRPYPTGELLESGRFLGGPGYPWAIMKGRIQGENGYIRLPVGHPWLELDDDNLDTKVWGGDAILYENRWLGFDTNHEGDVWPGTLEDRLGYPVKRLWSRNEMHRELYDLTLRASAATTPADPPVDAAGAQSRARGRVARAGAVALAVGVWVTADAIAWRALAWAVRRDEVGS